MALYQPEVQEFVVNASSSDNVEPEEEAVVDEIAVLDLPVSSATVFCVKIEYRRDEGDDDVAKKLRHV